MTDPRWEQSSWHGTNDDAPTRISGQTPQQNPAGGLSHPPAVVTPWNDSRSYPSGPADHGAGPQSPRFGTSNSGTPYGAQQYDAGQYGAPGYAPPASQFGGPYPQGAYPQGPGGPGVPRIPGVTVDAITGEPLSDKSKVAAGFLQFFLGCFGAGRFYVGDTTIGAIQLGLFLFGLVTLFFIVGIFIIWGVSLWAFVDAILMWTGSVRDSQGRKLR